jgi:hypothetical protein
MFFLVQQTRADHGAPGLGDVALRAQIHDVAHEKIFAVAGGVENLGVEFDFVHAGDGRRLDGRRLELGEGADQFRFYLLFFLFAGSGGKGHDEAGKAEDKESQHGIVSR